METTLRRVKGRVLVILVPVATQPHGVSSEIRLNPPSKQPSSGSNSSIDQFTPRRRRLRLDTVRADIPLPGALAVCEGIVARVVRTSCIGTIHLYLCANNGGLNFVRRRSYTSILLESVECTYT